MTCSCPVDDCADKVLEGRGGRRIDLNRQRNIHDVAGKGVTRSGHFGCHILFIIIFEFNVIL